MSAKNEVIPPGTEADDVKEGKQEKKTEEVVSYPVKNYNILLVGDSGVGKSTFKRYLGDLHHVSEGTIFRQTADPETSILLFSIGKNFISLTVIDTPGTNEASGDGNSKTNVNLKSIIASFVKRNMTHIHLVLLVVNSSTGITKPLLESMTQTVNFLGREMAKNIALLVTHFETKSEVHEQQWITTFSASPDTSFLRRALGAGFLFTGALDERLYANIKIRDGFLQLQTARRNKLFQILQNSIAASLRTDSVNKYMSQLSMQEAIVSKLDSLQELASEKKSNEQALIHNRMKLSQMIAEFKDAMPPDLKEAAEQLIDKMAGYPTNGEIDQQKLKQDREEYIRISAQVDLHYSDALIHDSVTASLTNASCKLINELQWELKLA